MTEAKKIHYLFVGNPGVGKSTMLNGLICDPNPRFKSGFSPGKGMTSALQKEEHGGDVFMDTPGLADVEMRKRAAEAISAALKQDGLYKVIFVVSLEAGRVRPQDRATMELVLQAAKEIGSNYAVIFNKVSRAAVKRISENKHERDQILGSLFHGSAHTTACVYCNQKDPELDDQDNVVKPLPEKLRDFIVAQAPPIHITPSRVVDVKGNQFEELTAKFEEELKKLHEETQALHRKMQEQREQQARELAELWKKIQAAQLLKEQSDDIEDKKQRAHKEEEFMGKLQEAVATMKNAALASDMDANEFLERVLGPWGNDNRAIFDAGVNIIQQAANQGEHPEVQQAAKDMGVQLDLPTVQAPKIMYAKADKLWLMEAGSDAGSCARTDLRYFEITDAIHEQGWLMLGHSPNRRPMIVVKKGDFVCQATGWRRIWNDTGSRRELDYDVFLPTCASPDYEALGVVCCFGTQSHSEPSNSVLQKTALVHKSCLEHSDLASKTDWSKDGMGCKYSLSLKELLGVGTMWPCEYSDKFFSSPPVPLKIKGDRLLQKPL